MNYILTKSERETIITFNEADPTAEIFTYNKALTNKLNKLVENRPEEVKALKPDNGYGASTFTVPKKWVKVNASLILSDEQRTALSERARLNVSQKTPITHGVKDI